MQGLREQGSSQFVRSYFSTSTLLRLFLVHTIAFKLSRSQVVFQLKYYCGRDTKQRNPTQAPSLLICYLLKQHLHFLQQTLHLHHQRRHLPRRPPQRLPRGPLIPSPQRRRQSVLPRLRVPPTQDPTHLLLFPFPIPSQRVCPCCLAVWW